jgi:hypothetical protein
MKLRGSLVRLRTNTTTRSVDSLEAVRLEKHETRKGAFLGRKFPKKSTHPPPWAFFFLSSVPLAHSDTMSRVPWADVGGRLPALGPVLPIL